MNEKLKNPPIVEAIIGISLKGKINLEHKNRILNSLPEPYNRSTFKEQKEFQASFNVSPVTGVQSQAFQNLGFKGFTFGSHDKSTSVQFNMDGFLFSVRQIYPGWEIFYSQFKILWNYYQEFAQAIEIGRLGVRFVNHVKFSETEGYNDYFHTRLQKPEDMDIELKEFLYQESYQSKDYQYQINLVKGLIPMTSAQLRHILDIDVATLNPFLIDEKSIDSHLANIRKLKNKTFFGSLTQKAKEEFNK